MWTNKPVVEIRVDIEKIMASIAAAEDQVIWVSRYMHDMVRAHSIFGQRVNRANRHKFRRVLLAVKQGAYQ